MNSPQDIEVPLLKLRNASTDEHCEGLRYIKKSFFWWYMGMGGISWNYSVPFKDQSGKWWYQLKPGLCWPVEVLSPDHSGEEIPLPRKWLGYQHITHDESTSNSRMMINVIEDLPAFGPASITDKRRNIRAGAKNCALELLERKNLKAAWECLEVWKNCNQRTGWKKRVDSRYFLKSWDMLFETPGVSVILGREAESGKAAGFLITKLVGDTAYVDTIASCTDLLNTRVNDLLMHSFLRSAQAQPEIKKAHYSLVSYIETLEKFKRSHGFRPVSYPAFTFLMPAVAQLIKYYNLQSYNRMMGKMEVPAA
ncbi:MAG TPA: hypothetical protein VGK71_05865 [Nitrospirota bacterium]